MSKEIQSRIVEHIQSAEYRPKKPRAIAKDLELAHDENYSNFRSALHELMSEGRVVLGASGSIVLPSQKSIRDEFVGIYRHNKRGFGFVIPQDTTIHEDLFIPPGDNLGAMTGDVVRAKITNRGHKQGKEVTNGRITEVIERKNKRFVGSLAKIGQDWVVLPDGNTLIEPVSVPDAGSKYIRPGTKVVVELTSFPTAFKQAEGVITEILGQAGEKDVDLKSVIVQFNLPADFPEEVKLEARRAVDSFDPETERARRLDLTHEIVCTIDPDDAKDYDDAISLTQLGGGEWELGVHIADVSHFVKKGTELDLEAAERGNSTYFPGHVIPMLPEILSNGVCSLQEGVPRLCKSAFIVYGEDAKPIRTRFANTIIKSRKRLRYTEAQDLIDGKTEIRHPAGAKTRADYDSDVLEHLQQMNDLAKRLQARRKLQGQLNLDLPQVQLVLDQDGKVIDAVPEDDSFTHTLIEMFMVEANEAVARLLDYVEVPFLRRTHPDPDLEDSEKLRHFAQVAGHKLPKTMDRFALQQLLSGIKGRPEAFAINLAVLKTLTRAEYSPERIGHFALASQHYGHFTSPIRRYADLTIHRLMDGFFQAVDADFTNGPIAPRGKRGSLEIPDAPTFKNLVELGKHISFTERRSEDAERELRQVKILSLMKNHIGDEFPGVITGITNFGLFIQLGMWLVDGLIRYSDLIDDWWEVDDRSGVVKGQRTGIRLGIGDPVKVRVVKVDVPRRELDLVIVDLKSKMRPGTQPQQPQSNKKNGKRGKNINTSRGRNPGRRGRR